MGKQKTNKSPLKSAKGVFFIIMWLAYVVIDFGMSTYRMTQLSPIFLIKNYLPALLIFMAFILNCGKGGKAASVAAVAAIALVLYKGYSQYAPYTMLVFAANAMTAVLLLLFARSNDAKRQAGRWIGFGLIPAAMCAGAFVVSGMMQTYITDVVYLAGVPQALAYLLGFCMIRRKKLPAEAAAATTEEKPVETKVNASEPVQEKTVVKTEPDKKQTDKNEIELHNDWDGTSCTINEEGITLTNAKGEKEYFPYEQISKITSQLGNFALYDLMGAIHLYAPYGAEKGALKDIVNFACLCREAMQRKNETHVRCNVCGHVFCYSQADLEQNLMHAKQARNSAMLSAGQMLFTSQLLGKMTQSEAERHLDKIVDFSHCPKCHSANLTVITAEEAKAAMTQPAMAAPAVSAADELKKFKELLDAGAITQEEFDAKKKQLLGL